MRAGTERSGRKLRWLALAAALVLLAACRPLDPGSQPGNAPDDSGGIGGTGKGSINLSNSGLVVQGTRRFETTAGTRFTLDGREVAPEVIRDAGPGLVAQVDVSSDVDPDFTRGTVVRLAAGHVLVGPVTGTDPLRVLGQPVRITQATTGGSTPGWADEGTVVAVSGFPGPDNVVLATRVSRAPEATQWRLTGRVWLQLEGEGFMVGLQPVRYEADAAPEGCGDGLRVGDRVVVVAEPGDDDDDFEAGDVLTGVTGVTCHPTGLDLPADTGGDVLPAHVEGVVETVDGPAFQVDGHAVTTSGDTRLVGGDLDRLASGDKVEVTGLLDVATGALMAKEVIFH